MPKAARKGDKGRHDKEDLSAVQGSPDVFINGQPAVRVGDVYQSEAHPASSGSATVNINGKAAVRIGDSLAGHATASTGSPNVFIGDSSYGAAEERKRPVYEILLSQVTGSADPAFVYAEYPYKLYHNDRLVQQGNTDAMGIIAYEYEPPLKGKFRVDLFNGDTLELHLTPFAPSDTRRGVVQRLSALGYFLMWPPCQSRYANLSAFKREGATTENGQIYSSSEGVAALSSSILLKYQCKAQILTSFLSAPFAQSIIRYCLGLTGLRNFMTLPSNKYPPRLS